MTRQPHTAALAEGDAGPKRLKFWLADEALDARLNAKRHARDRDPDALNDGFSSIDSIREEQINRLVESFPWDLPFHYACCHGAAGHLIVPGKVQTIVPVNVPVDAGQGGDGVRRGPWYRRLLSALRIAA